MKLRSAALLSLAPGRALSQNVVQFEVTRGLPGAPHTYTPSSLARRGPYSERLINSIAGGGYYVRVQVGTPKQNLTMLLDTGSSDAWVLGHDADLCTSPDLQSIYGMSCTDTFDPSKSSTSKLVEEDGFEITYLDDTSASGDYITDDFTIGGTTVKSLQMAYVTQAVRGTGILGLGFNTSERAATKYPNIIDEMARQGLIKSKAYSLYLNDRRTDSGSILFGGIDTDKFIGPLQILPLYKGPGRKGDSSAYSSFELDFSGVTLTHTNGTRRTLSTATLLNHPAPAVLDSGTTLSYLPDELAEPIYAAVGAVYSPDLRMALVDCSRAETDPDFHLTFTFPPTGRITVPLWSLTLDILPPAYNNPPSRGRLCVFGIQSTALFEPSPPPSSSKSSSSAPPSSSNFTLLGATFLRSAYVVYDLSHHQIGLAQANLNSSTSAVVELFSFPSNNNNDDDDNNGNEDDDYDHDHDGDDDSDDDTNEKPTGLPHLTGVPAQQTTHTPTPTPPSPGDESIGIGGTGAAVVVAAGVVPQVVGTGRVREVWGVVLLGGVLVCMEGIGWG
ncbi:aspartic peptidase domain-containing protein [Dichotomopilus funicola]|uniref:Aspartic peptidase domain-containing protein n=1 Tax=Dichotomopilus funicola TaxID=1934379 RepID=A0AAN6UVZ5_9PEZI|nr:aspartic peptidase domain-containing protein [Dichotomopilus funicola]